MRYFALALRNRITLCLLLTFESLPCSQVGHFDSVERLFALVTGLITSYTSRYCITLLMRRCDQPIANYRHYTSDLSSLHRLQSPRRSDLCRLRSSRRSASCRLQSHGQSALFTRRSSNPSQFCLLRSSHRSALWLRVVTSSAGTLPLVVASAVGTLPPSVTSFNISPTVALSGVTVSSASPQTSHRFNIMPPKVQRHATAQPRCLTFETLNNRSMNHKVDAVRQLRSGTGNTSFVLQRRDMRIVSPPVSKNYAPADSMFLSASDIFKKLRKPTAPASSTMAVLPL